MSIVRIRKVVHDRGIAKWIMGILAVIFIIGFCLMGISNRQSSPDRRSFAHSGVIAKVNGEAVDSALFEKQYIQQLRQVAPPGRTSNDEAKDASRIEERVGPLRAEMVRGQTLDQAINTLVVVQAAKKAGIRVSSGEADKTADKAVEDQIAQLRDQLLANSKGPKTDDALDKQIQRIKPGTTLASLRTEMRSSIDTDQVTQQLMIQKLVAQLQKNVDTSDKAVRESFDVARLRQITIGTDKRSDADAQKIAKDTVAKLRGGANFAQMAKQVSDDMYKSHGGDWGFPMPKIYLPKDLGDVAFKLKVGEIGEPVRTAQGYVILQVQSKESKLPKDYNDPKKQQEYKQRFMASTAQQLESTYFESLRKSAKIEIIDPEMKALSMLKQADIRNPKTALPAVAEYESAIKDSRGDNLTVARIYTQIAVIYEANRQSKTPAPTKEEAAKYRDAEQAALQNALQHTEQNDLRLMLSDILIEQKSYEKAAENLSYVGDNAYNDPSAHQAALQRYEKMQAAGYSKVSTQIAAEQKWLAENEKEQKARQGVPAASTQRR